jgi:DNA-binding response OmpR family regulator
MSQRSRETILTIEDDEAIRRGITDSLRYSGLEVIEAADGRQGLDAALTRSYDLLLLDLVLPFVSGLEILQKLRLVKPTVPVIILSAKGEEADRVRGLRGGADDYVVKPFGALELLARIEAVLRRSSSRPIDVSRLSTEAGYVDMDRSEIVVHHGAVERLTPKEIDVLRFLAQNPTLPLSREDLLRAVWQIDPRGVSSRVVDMTISRLREKLKLIEAGANHVLETVHGKGYMLSRRVDIQYRDSAQTKEVVQ